MSTSRAVSTTLAALVTAALIAPAAAPAKGIQAVTVCGASGCQAVERHGDQEWILGGSQPINPPSKPAPFYKVIVTLGGEGGYSDKMHLAYVPSLHYVRAMDENAEPVWTVVEARQALRALERVTHGIKPLPASKLGVLEPSQVKAPAIRVDEVYDPAAEAEAAARTTAAATGDDGMSWIAWASGAAGVLVLGGLALAARHRLVRRPRRSSTPPSAAGPAPR